MGSRWLPDKEPTSASVLFLRILQAHSCFLLVTGPRRHIVECLFNFDGLQGVPSGGLHRRVPI